MEANCILTSERGPSFLVQDSTTRHSQLQNTVEESMINGCQSSEAERMSRRCPQYLQDNEITLYGAMMSYNMTVTVPNHRMYIQHKSDSLCELGTLSDNDELAWVHRHNNCTSLVGAAANRKTRSAPCRGHRGTFCILLLCVHWERS